MDQWLITKELPVHMIAVCGLVYNDEGRILLLHSAKRGWEFPGGVVEPGETLLDALRREIKEETGFLTEPDSFVGVFQNLAIKDGYGPLEGLKLPPITTLTFRCHITGGTATTSDESDQIRFVAKEEAKAMVVYPTYDHRLLAMLQMDGSLTFSSYSFNRQDDPKMIVYQDTVLRPLGSSHP